MDEIQRKLELIGKQLTGANLHQHVVSTCPLLFAAIDLITGVLLQYKSDLSLWVWLVLAVLCMVFGVLFFAIQKNSRLGSHRLVLLGYSAVICFVCLGAIRMISFKEARPNDVRKLIGDERRLAAIRGTIDTDPYLFAVSRNGTG